MVIKDGKYSVVSQYHFIQNDLGSLFELSITKHVQSQYTNVLHPHLPRRLPFNPVDRDLFGSDRQAYWQQKAEEEVNRRKLMNYRKKGG